MKLTRKERRELKEARKAAIKAFAAGLAQATATALFGNLRTIIELIKKLF